MHHVSCSRHTSQRAVRNIPVQTDRLLAFDKSIFRMNAECHRHFGQHIPYDLLGSND